LDPAVAAVVETGDDLPVGQAEVPIVVVAEVEDDAAIGAEGVAEVEREAEGRRSGLRGNGCGKRATGEGQGNDAGFEGVEDHFRSPIGKVVARISASPTLAFLSKPLRN